MTTAPSEAAPDLLYGLAAIGDHIGLSARQVEHLVARGGLPVFRIAGKICARRSTLAQHFADQEAKARQAGTE